MDYSYEGINQAAAGLKKLLPANFTAEICIICGSGLSALSQAVTAPRCEVPYSQVKGFPISTGQSGIFNGDIIVLN